ncbi:MAG: hypothetical protein CVU11_07175 [Bacteroidetes bacterium HGW-Bacteroidetes-6]|nr:MAG: hypothetical protein CVU11_07175 [Bacteroidetes bacterium HGW-Bacteroidetes-6]
MKKILFLAIVRINNLIYILLILTTVFATSCRKDSDLPPEDVGYSYFPYIPGDYRIFDVDSTFHDDFLDSTFNSTFQLKELYESYFIDAQGRKCIRIERWVKMSDTTDWYLRDVWYSCLDNFRAEKFEENVRYTRLAFPVRNGTQWDGNGFNDLDAQIYEYDNIDDTYFAGGQMYDSTVTVIQDFAINLIEEKNQFEVYARNIGLIYKKYKDVEKDFVTGTIVSGIDYSYELTEYGHN